MVKTESVTVEPTIAIVGSGPSGCYAAQFLRKRWPDAEIVVIDRLDHPYTGPGCRHGLHCNWFHRQGDRRAAPG